MTSDLERRLAEHGAGRGAFEYAAPECRELLQACVAAAVPPPDVGYELVNELDRVAGTLVQ